jgi:hypothetical protein
VKGKTVFYTNNKKGNLSIEDLYIISINLLIHILFHTHYIISYMLYNLYIYVCKYIY